MVLSRSSLSRSLSLTLMLFALTLGVSQPAWADVADDSGGGGGGGGDDTAAEEETEKDGCGGDDGATTALSLGLGLALLGGLRKRRVR